MMHAALASELEARALRVVYERGFKTALAAVLAYSANCKVRPTFEEHCYLMHVVDVVEEIEDADFQRFMRQGDSDG